MFTSHFDSSISLDVPALRNLPSTLRSHDITIVDESGTPAPSIDDWMDRVIRDFQSNTAIISMEFFAKFVFDDDGISYDGFVEVGRNGRFAARLKH